MTDVFLDTNILLYIHDVAADDKRKAALDWVRYLAERQKACINLQVLNEIANVLERKRWFAEYSRITAIVDAFTALGSSPVTLATVHQARWVKSQTRYSWWDCILIASAIELGCSHFLSEDLHDGQQIGGLAIVNPFLHQPAEIFGK